jgi:hypothetical protein
MEARYSRWLNAMLPHKVLKKDALETALFIGGAKVRSGSHRSVR